MRTTIVLDDAYLQEIASTAKTEHTSMKNVLNRTVARGLGYCAEKQAEWSCATHILGVARLNIDEAWKLADRLEEEAIVDKFELNK